MGSEKVPWPYDNACSKNIIIYSDQVSFVGAHLHWEPRYFKEYFMRLLIWYLLKYSFLLVLLPQDWPIPFILWRYDKNLWSSKKNPSFKEIHLVPFLNPRGTFLFFFNIPWEFVIVFLFNFHLYLSKELNWAFSVWV